jgi:putative membrane protein
LGEIAERNALSPEVKTLSTSIITQNAKVQDNIRTLANAAEIELQPALTPEYVAIIDTIQTYQGAKFDSAFIELVIEEHKDDIDRLNKMARKTENAISRREVTENVEILQTQLKKAEEIKASMK